MQLIKVISLSNGTPGNAAPLTVVVVLSMLKDAYEDYRRY